MLRFIGFLMLVATLYILHTRGSNLGSNLFGILLGAIGCACFIAAELKSPSHFDP